MENDNNKFQYYIKYIHLTLISKRFINYHKIITNYEKYIKKIYSNSSKNINYEGFLIYLNDFKEFHYYKKILTIKQIEFKTSQYLINMLLNKNEFILINKDLWKELCKKGEENDPPIIYSIDNESISIKFEKDKILKFKNYNKDNIINFYYYKKIISI